jgi:hypothetical protein
VANIAPPSADARDLLGFISYGYAQQLLRLDRIEEYLLFLYAHRCHVHTRGGWTAGEVSGITGGMPLFCMPAQMTIPLLLRWMLVSEDSAGEQLYLARGVPREWLGSGEAVAIADAPTRWGMVGFHLRADTQAHRIDGHVDLPAVAPGGVWLSLRLPSGKRLVRALVNGVKVPPGGRHGDALPIAGRPGERVELQAFYA